MEKLENAFSKRGGKILLSGGSEEMQREWRFYEQLIYCAEVRQDYLTEVIKKCEDRLATAPAGVLRISSQRGKPTYYWRKEKEDKQGIYLPATQRGLAERLAQKSADQQLLQTLEKELSYIARFIDKYPAPAESVYEGLSEERKKLVLPLEESDEEFARRWQAQEFMPHPVPPSDPGLVTERGETVRSRAELIIANMANQMLVPYFYEKPLYLEGHGTVYTDLVALNVRLRKEIFIEYLGMMHDPEYAARAVERINAYIRNGYYPGENLILIFEAEGSPLDTRLVRTMLEKYCL